MDSLSKIQKRIVAIDNPLLYLIHLQSVLTPAAGPSVYRVFPLVYKLSISMNVSAVIVKPNLKP